jgi:L-fuculose-phosphate aldolase
VLLERERELVVRYARRLRPDGLVVGTAGNLSLRSGTLTVVTPTSVDYDELDATSIAVVNEGGLRVDGAFRPSSELPMHLGAYAATGAGAVVHTHSPFATALATAGIELPPIHYLAADLGGRVRVAPYATFGSRQLAESVAEGLEGRNAVLLERHGTLTIGETLEQAYARAVTLEWLAALFVRASSLAPLRPLDDGELERVAARLDGCRRERGSRSRAPAAATS